MMAFARKQDLTPTSVDPALLCASVAGLVEPTLGGTITIDWTCPQTDHNLFVDQSQLELALINLILNARDAMPGGGTVRVEVDGLDAEDDPELEHGRYLRIRVSDEGDGIPAHLLDKITEPFFTTKEAGKGTGLGLSMVVGFVQQSGGKIRIDSSPGDGTTIDLFLPSTPQPAAAKAPAKGIAKQPAIRVKSVLLVDDDEAVRTVLGEQLRELGVTVEEVSDGAAALDLLKRNGQTYDLLLTDFAMPGMNGVDTIMSARADFPEMRTVLLTGYADDAVIAGIKETIPVLRKPVDLAELRRALA
jgi:CheY-like chemotaxis protein